MNNLQISARYKIHSGKLEEFKKFAQECYTVVKEKDNDTLQFDWYFDQTQTECVLRETYPDSNALLVHIENIGELLGKLMALGDFSAEVYGHTSEELLKALSGLNIKFYNFYLGL